MSWKHRFNFTVSGFYRHAAGSVALTANSSVNQHLSKINYYALSLSFSLLCSPGPNTAFNSAFQTVHVWEYDPGSNASLEAGGHTGTGAASATALMSSEAQNSPLGSRGLVFKSVSVEPGSNSDLAAELTPPSSSSAADVCLGCPDGYRDIYHLFSALIALCLLTSRRGAKFSFFVKHTIGCCREHFVQVLSRNPNCLRKSLFGFYSCFPTEICVSLESEVIKECQSAVL